MNYVIVTVKYGQQDRLDVALPLDVPNQALAAELARTFGLSAALDWAFCLAQESGDRPGQILPPGQTLGQAGVQDRDCLLLCSEGASAATIHEAPCAPASLATRDGWVFQIKELVTCIGRSSPNVAVDLDLSCFDVNKRVSRQHATLEYVQGSYSLVDRDSSNGTWLNGQKLAPSQPQRLKTGDWIQFGGPQGVLLCFQEQARAETTPELATRGVR
jgi:hypothetical protein